MPERTRLSSADVSVPETDTSVYDAIFRRRSTKTFIDEPVSEETINRLFDAAVWAPNHRLTDPTRFFALRKDSDARTRVAELGAEIAYERVVNPNPDQKRRSADATRARVMDAPAAVYVYSVPGDNEEVTRENYATSCCAVQNIALAAVAEGLHVDWTTGGVTQHPDLAATLGAESDWQMVGALFIGKADVVPNSRRRPASEVVSWL